MKIENHHIREAIERLKDLPSFMDLKDPSTRFIERSERYLNLLLYWNKTHDLVAPPKNIENFLLIHLIDSLAAFHICFKETTLIKVGYLDIGTGAGIPGFFWHFLFEDRGAEVQTILLEPREKRVHFLEEVVRSEKIKNVSIRRARLGDLKEEDFYGVNYVSFRAIYPDSGFTSSLSRLTKERSDVFVYWLAGSKEKGEIPWNNYRDYSISSSENARRVFTYQLSLPIKSIP